MNGRPGVYGESELISEEGQKSLHELWEDAVKDAAYKIARDKEPGWFTIETEAHVRHSSPGWVDGFRVWLNPGES